MCAMAANLELGLVEEEAGRKRGAWSSMAPQKRRICDAVEEERILQLMMGPVDRPPAAGAGAPLLLHELAQRSATLGLQTLKRRSSSRLFGIQSSDDMCSSSTSPALELDSNSSEPLPSGWEKCLDLQTGSIYYLNRNTGLTTSCDPRRKSASVPALATHPHHVHLKSWAGPTSPSSSSDLTFEDALPPSSSACTHPPAAAGAPPQETCLSPPRPHSELDLDLTLRLRPCSSKEMPGPPPPHPSHKHSLLPSPSQGADPGADSSSLNRKHIAQTGNKSSCANHKYSRGVLSFLQPSTGLSSASYAAPASTLQLRDGLGAGSMGMASTLAPSAAAQFRRLEDRMTGSTIGEIRNMERSDMVTVGCANCLMFVMLPDSGHPNCPRCGASLDVTSSSTLYSTDIQLPQPPPSKKAKLAAAGAVSLSLSLSPLLKYGGND